MDHTASMQSREGEGQVEQWLREAKNGSHSVLGQLLDACRGYMLLVANRALDSDIRQKTGASDLVQETFLEAQRDFAGFRGTSEREFYAWLTQILINRLRHAVRHYRGTRMRDIGREIPLDHDLQRVAAELTGEDETPSALVAAWEEEQSLRESMERLSARDRQILILRAWQGLSFSEIGVKMGLSAEAARKVWLRAVERLSVELDIDR